MRALRTLKAKMCAYAIVFLASIGLGSSPLLAGSSDFTGIYAAVHGSIQGIAMDGRHIDNDAKVSGGTAGALVPLAGLEAGVNLPIGPNLFITIGTSWVDGKADVFRADDEQNNADVVVQAKDYSSVFIQPSISLWDNAAIFVKMGMVHANLEAFGDITSQPDNLSGTTYAIGTQTMSNAGLFMKTEAGATVFDHFRMSGVGESGTNSHLGINDSRVEGDPLAAYGRVTIGFKF
tara:strand:- start:25 stop:726 length:702 start_codon:yes stop_codon:yes gene_type:complete